MPEFNECALDGIAAAVEHAPAQVSDDARRNAQVVVELDEVVVLVEWDIVRQWIIRPLRHNGRSRERFGEIARQGKSSRGERHAFEKTAAVNGDVKRLGFVGFHSSERI